MRAVPVACAVVVSAVLGACSSARFEGDPDGAGATDAARTDAAGPDAAGPDGPGPDAATDAADDAAVDAAVDAAIDAGPDAPPCTISMGHSPALDGVADVADYPAAQRLTPGATLAAGDEVAVTWDPTWLYVTVTSQAFLDGSKPLHVYVETATALGAAAPRTGKEYGGLTARVPFDATHLIAARRTDDFGTGAYDGVYTSAGAQPWTTRALALVPGTDVFASADMKTLSVRAPWSALGGCPLAMRVAVHVVNGAAGNEWKDLVPSTHTPWAAPGGGYYEATLTADPAISGWMLR